MVVGDTVSVLVDGRTVGLVVVALVVGDAVPRMVVGPDYFGTLFPGRGDASVLVGFAPDLAVENSRTVVEEATAASPTVRIVSTFDARERVAADLGQATALVNALLAVAILISLVGVTNTLTLSVLERTRESAMLRALGLAASGLRTMLTAEALVFGLVGGLIGAILGTGFGPRRGPGDQRQDRAGRTVGGAADTRRRRRRGRGRRLAAPRATGHPRAGDRGTGACVTASVGGGSSADGYAGRPICILETCDYTARVRDGNDTRTATRMRFMRVVQRDSFALPLGGS